MRRLVCACVVRKPPKTGFLAWRPILYRKGVTSLSRTNQLIQTFVVLRSTLHLICVIHSSQRSKFVYDCMLSLHLSYMKHLGIVIHYANSYIMTIYNVKYLIFANLWLRKKSFKSCSNLVQPLFFMLKMLSAFLLLLHIFKCTSD